jgi:hypothetical protein
MLFFLNLPVTKNSVSEPIPVFAKWCKIFSIQLKVKLSLYMPRKHMGEWRYSSTYS